MIVVENPNEMHRLVKPLKSTQRIALVPTMGNLHEGHLQLIRKAKEIADSVVISIFVNPLQFAPNEDFSRYPRTLEQDLNTLKALDIAYVFVPDIQAIYPDKETQTKVHVPGISDKYCGHFRPPFFYGITTVVAKLFNIVQPDIALFGEKDYQQFFIIKKMVRDLSFPIEVISVATLREQQGLALSSRNQYLSEHEKQVAPSIFRALCKMRDQLLAGDIEHESLIIKTTHGLTDQGFKVDYLHICNRDTLEVARSADQNLIIIIAAWLGTTRLIDNLSICLD